MRSRAVPLLLLSVLSALPASAADDDRELVDLKNLERNLRFALARKGLRVDATIGVYLGRGAFAPSALALVRRLDERRRAPRLLFEADFSDAGLAKLRRVVFPGGWAPSMSAALAPGGLAALRRFVKGGGQYAGICAGAYLACAEVEWEGVAYPYGLRLVEGRAIGPLNAIAPWPQSAAVRLDLGPALYAGGSRFDVAGARVLARYPDRGVAMITARFGKGRVVLTGAHVEFDSKRDKDLLAGWAEGIECGEKKLVDLLFTGP